MMFLCELCGKDTGGREPTANWTLTETFGELTLNFVVTATRKLCDECIKSFVVTKTEQLDVEQGTKAPPESLAGMTPEAPVVVSEEPITPPELPRKRRGK